MGLHCPVRAHWDDTSVSQTPIKADGKMDRGIIDRQEKGSLIPLSSLKKKSKKKQQRREVRNKEGSSNNLYVALSRVLLSKVFTSRTRFWPFNNNRAKKKTDQSHDQQQRSEPGVGWIIMNTITRHRGMKHCTWQGSCPTTVTVKHCICSRAWLQWSSGSNWMF